MRLQVGCLIALVLLGLAGCGPQQKTNPKIAEADNVIDSKKLIVLEESEIRKIDFVDTSQYAILPVRNAKPFLGIAQQITLSNKEILLIECAISKSVKLYNQSRDAFLIDLKKYKRQYFPGVTSSGNREVWIRCINEDAIKVFRRFPTPYDWRKDYTVIMDGGDNIFSLKVNLTTRRTSDFVTNGSETL